MTAELAPPRLLPPHDGLLVAAEAMALAGFEALVAGVPAGHSAHGTNGHRPRRAATAEEAAKADAAARAGADVRAAATGAAASVAEAAESGNGPDAAPGGLGAFEGLDAWLDAADPRLPLAQVADGFALERSETALLALLFAAAASEHVARHVAASSNAGGVGVPVWLLQRLIPGIRTDSLAASAGLRRFGLIAVEREVLRVESRVWLREPVLDRFCGVPSVEPEVAARIAPVRVNGALANEALGRQVHRALADRGPDHLSPVVLVGAVEVGTVAASIAALGLHPHVMDASAIPDDPEARDRLARLWSRDAALDRAALIVRADERAVAPLADFVDRIAGHVILSGLRLTVDLRRPVRILAEPPEVAGGPVDRWRSALGPARSARLGGAVARVAAQFRLGPVEIDAVCAQVAEEIDAAVDEGSAGALLWHAAGRAARTSAVPGVAVVEPAYTWADIVLAPAIERALRRVEMHVRHATTVLDEWGFGERMGGRGRGVTALFAGPSGTGKTMAAEVLASSLDLRMMVIDLSQIISKYVGETSKNIAAAFDQAERSGAVMVWNEGDAIWGARGTVGNATDRHVNAEIGDLLQRIEAFRGFTIVTTNLRKAIDPAFIRRFRFAIDFPMPTEAERLRLWSQAFPKGAPIDALDWTELASLPLTGGSIRNVALGSAFLAAEDGGRIDGPRIAAELAEELQKHDQPMPTLSWGGGA